MAKKRKANWVNAPTQVIFLIALAIAVIAVLSIFVFIPTLSANTVWIALLAYVVLAAGCVLKGF